MFKRAAVLMVSCVALLAGCGGNPQVENEASPSDVTSVGSELTCGADGEAVCNGVCTSVYSDLENCGWCGMRCGVPGGNNVCWYGTCYACDSNGTNCVAI
ncbi:MULTISPECIES: hypothetical protein [unclassified Corallococcus]|uniref:hypothetical protein n=1 Tax=unclassified Corallococcus TaxID=2685029 RepID=UPI001A8C9868|nr:MULTISPECIES: hypothetical protein [unclassified Corallococcus]MBN9682625.1 hypothetical protein [Corallococcus sp. NCSPR001]WAS85830.1 hypothetical protein O0N60_02385 [Corallococcus sp. NCRR]